MNYVNLCEKDEMSGLPAVLAVSAVAIGVYPFGAAALSNTTIASAS